LLALDMGRAQTGEREHIVVFTLHHIVSDGWSTDILIREFAALYEAFAAGRTSPLAPLSLQYADYAAWQREWLSGEPMERQLAYWRETLAECPTSLDLPTDHPRPAVMDHAGATLDFHVPKDVVDGLRKLCRREGATLFMGLLAAFYILLSRHSGQQDLCVGAPVANRRRVELEGLIG
ncbi:condensation domain-containing protein, partial [Methylosinus sp. Sm6]|uniref:condensation domain-containing protein n=1 Tax=Methylosinus sp. Sm6 TaxID=2866948 RepID=UPI001C9A0B67